MKLLDFVHTYMDKRDPFAVLLVLVDLEKAFNRVSHFWVIQDLADMHVPGWLLQILISYLTDRSMFMRYSQTKSTKRSLPGSSPQGTFLGVLLFIIVFNGALLRPSVPRPDSLNLKYIDDLSLLQALNLKDLLIPDIFTPNMSAYDTRTKKPFREPKILSQRAFNSPLAYLTRLVNKL